MEVATETVAQLARVVRPEGTVAPAPSADIIDDREIVADDGFAAEIVTATALTRRALGSPRRRSSPAREVTRPSIARSIVDATGVDDRAAPVAGVVTIGDATITRDEGMSVLILGTPAQKATPAASAEGANRTAIKTILTSLTRARTSVSRAATSFGTDSNGRNDLTQLHEKLYPHL